MEYSVAVLSVDVLGVALAHNVSDLAVAVDIALGLGLQDQLALVSTGLTCVSANVAALACVGIQNSLFGLTVDEDDRSLRGLDGINDGLCRGGLNRVDDQNVNALLQKVLICSVWCSGRSCRQRWSRRSPYPSGTLPGRCGTGS